VRRAHHCGTPAFGVCFGHQLIGWAFGGVVVRNPHGWEIGSHDVEVNEEGRRDPLFDGLPSSLRVNLTHEDILDPVSLDGTPLRGLAQSARCQLQAVAIDEHVRAVQFHPEITGPICRAYIEARRERLVDQDPDVLMRATTDSAHGVSVLRNFRRAFVGS
jgi:GMP synthase (glutamine-hydrolysing)